MPEERPTSVLLVEDDEDDYILTRGLLRGIEGTRYEIEWVDNSKRALELIFQSRWDICLVDFRLGEHTGLELIRLARERGSRVPFILLTGMSDRETALEAMSAGASDYLVKGRTDCALLERSIRYAIQQARAMAALARRTEELARSNRELEQFASVVSHDLKSPLQIVTSSLELYSIKHGEHLSPDARLMIDRIMKAVMRAHALIDDLLRYARLNAVVKLAEPVELSSLVDTVIEDLEPAIAETMAQVTRTSLPRVQGNATLLYQVFNNLISNALKFHGASPPRIHIESVESEQRDQEWSFAVHDNGIGIPLEHRDTIFGMFRRLHRRDQYPGTGIGLALCQKIIERHGGRIWAESAPGQGSTFHFTLSKGQEHLLPSADPAT